MSAPAKESLYLSVCIPVYNELSTVEGAIEDADQVLDEVGRAAEILVLDDGSNDGSGELLRNLAGSLSRLRLLVNPDNRGAFAAFERLYSEARGELIFLNSADCQWHMSELTRMLHAAADHDIVVGRRIRKRYGPLRRLVSSLFNLLPLLLFGVRTHDAGSVKIYRRRVLDEISTVSSSVFVEAERIVRAARRGLSIGVVDVEHHPRRSGRATGVCWTNLWGSARDLVRCWWHLFVLRRL